MGGMWAKGIKGDLKPQQDFVDATGTRDACWWALAKNIPGTSPAPDTLDKFGDY
jgi:hypothetical protein